MTDDKTDIVMTIAVKPAQGGKYEVNINTTEGHDTTELLRQVIVAMIDMYEAMGGSFGDEPTH